MFDLSPLVLLGTGWYRFWIIGNRIVFWAAQRAADYNWASQPTIHHFTEVDWLSLHRMQWIQLVPCILELVYCRRPLDLLILHTGANDLPLMPSVQLTNLVVQALHRILEILPGFRRAWVDLLPR